MSILTYCTGLTTSNLSLCIVMIYGIETSRTPFETSLLPQRSFLQGRIREESDGVECLIRGSLERAERVEAKETKQRDIFAEEKPSR